MTIEQETYTVEELKNTLEFDFGIKGTDDLKAFRQRMAYYVRKGMIPRPVRIPRPDGKPGTIGVYSSDALVKLQSILRERENKGQTRQTLPKMPDAEGRPQRFVSVGFWLPEPLAMRIESQVKRGYPLSRQLLIGFDLMQEAGQGVPEAVFDLIMSYLGGEGPRRLPSDERLHYTCALVLANHLLERLDAVSRDLGTPWNFALSKYRFHFAVSEGHVWLASASRLNDNGEWETVPLKGTGNVEVENGRGA